MSHQLLSLIPMKSLTVWHGHFTRPSLPAGTARKDSGHLSGRRPLHLANARPFGRLKAPLGLSLLRCAAQTRACLWQAEQVHHTTSKEKQGVPDGERPAVHIAIACGFWQGASGWTHPVFFTMLHRFPHEASGIRHQHGSGSDAAHPGIVPIFCAGMPYKHARKQCHFPAYFPIFAV